MNHIENSNDNLRAIRSFIYGVIVSIVKDRGSNDIYKVWLNKRIDKWINARAPRKPAQMMPKDEVRWCAGKIFISVNGCNIIYRNTGKFI